MDNSVERVPYLRRYEYYMLVTYLPILLVSTSTPSTDMK